MFHSFALQDSFDVLPLADGDRAWCSGDLNANDLGGFPKVCGFPFSTYICFHLFHQGVGRCKQQEVIDPHRNDGETAALASYVCARVRAHTPEAMLSYYMVKLDVPGVAGLFEAIQGLQQLAYVFGPILKAFGLSHVDPFL